MVIVRPSIMQSCYKDPFPGWSDTISASGFHLMTIALGLLKRFYVAKGHILDVIPCDLTVAAICAFTVSAAKSPEPVFRVVHSTTSVKNPFKLADMFMHQAEHLRYYPFYSKASNVQPSY